MAQRPYPAPSRPSSPRASGCAHPSSAARTSGRSARTRSRHAATRAAERYGLAPTPADWAGVVLDVTDTMLGTRTGAVMLRRHSSGAEHWLVRLCGTQVIVVWKRESAVPIITVLPTGSMHHHSGRQHLDGRPRRERVRAEEWA